MTTKIQKEFSPFNGSLLNKISRTDLYSNRITISKVETAISNATSIEYPNRYQLIQLYNSFINFDPHLKGVIKHRKERIKGLPFNLTSGSNKTNEKAKDIFSKVWFKHFLDYTLDAMFLGNSLVELNVTESDIEINLIPRENVIPEFKQVKKDYYAINGDIDYSSPVYSKRLVDINNNFDSRDLGELINTVKYLAMKNEALFNWSQYLEIFGQPLRVATTDSKDPVELDMLYSFLKDMGRSGSIVKDSQTLIELTEAKGTGNASELFKGFETWIDEQISKLILGGTMITDNGSSRSQAEVHQSNSYLFTKADITFVETVINVLLIPVLVRKNVVPSDTVFTFKEPELQTIEQKILIDKFLLENFKVKNIEYFESRYVGAELEFLNDDTDKKEEELTNE